MPSGATSTSFTAKSVSLALDETFSTVSTNPVTSMRLAQRFGAVHEHIGARLDGPLIERAGDDDAAITTIAAADGLHRIQRIVGELIGLRLRAEAARSSRPSPYKLLALPLLRRYMRTVCASFRRPLRR